MKCSYCNSDISENMNNCPNCGATINKIVAPTNFEQGVEPQVQNNPTPNITIVGGQLEDFQDNEINNNQNTSKKPKKKHGFLKFLLILIILIMLGYFFADKYYDKIPKEIQNVISPIFPNKNINNNVEEVPKEETKEEPLNEEVPLDEEEPQNDELEEQEERLEGTFTTSELGLKNEVSNYTMSVSLKLSLNVEETIVSASSVVNEVIDVLNKKSHLTSKAISNGTIVSSEMYIDYKDMIGYVKDSSGEWTKTKDILNYNNSTNTRIDFSYYYDLFDEYGGLTTLPKDNKYDYSFIIPKEYIMSNLESQGLSPEIVKDDVKGYVKIKDNYLQEINYDFSDVMENINKYEMTIKISKIDESENVTIPENVINSKNV